MAEIFIRLVDDGDSTREALKRVADARAEVQRSAHGSSRSLGALPGFETAVVSFTTDIPAFGGTWGSPFLLGPGSIHVAHTSEEHVHKDEIVRSRTDL